MPDSWRAVVELIYSTYFFLPSKLHAKMKIFFLQLIKITDAMLVNLSESPPPALYNDWQCSGS
jgi:hypothetical protein